MKSIYLCLATMLLGISTIAQQVNKPIATNTQKPPVSKTFIVSTATSKDLPAGISFENNTIVAKAGYKFVTGSVKGTVNLVDAKGTQQGHFWCHAGCKSDKGSCSIGIGKIGGTESISCVAVDCSSCDLVVTIGDDSAKSPKAAQYKQPNGQPITQKQ